MTQVKDMTDQDYNKLNIEGETFFQEGNYKEALSRFNKALDLSPTSPIIHNNLGVLYYRLGKLQSSIDHFSSALRIDPYSRAAILNLSAIMTDMKRSDYARYLLSLYLEKYPDDEEIRKHLLEIAPATTSSQAAREDFDLMLPRIFTVETSLACELKCPECERGTDLVTRKKGVLSLEKFKIIAEKIKPFGPQYLYLHLYGEPMLNPEIISIIRHASTFSKTNISTNGMSLTEEKADQLITSGVTDVIVSIDGVTQETYEKYRVGGDVGKAFHSLEMLHSLNLNYGSHVNIVPQFVVFGHNQSEMTAFSEYCNSIGLQPTFKAPHIRHPSSFSFSDIPQFIRPHFPDVATQRQAMSACVDPREVFTILLDGSVVICCYDYNGMTSFGNIFEQSVLEIWNSPKCRQFRWDIISGKAPLFCTGNCLLYFLQPPDLKEGRNSASKIEPVFSAREEFQQQEISPPGPLSAHSNMGWNDRRKQLSILFINTYYPAFLDSCYKRKPGLHNESYMIQHAAIQSERFGDSDFYSHGMIEAGWQAQDAIVNCSPLQQAWARENDCRGSNLEIAVEQIRRQHPSVVYIQDINIATADFINALRPYTDLIAAQHASPIPPHIDFGLFDVVFTAAPHFVPLFRRFGIPCYYMPLAFDPRVTNQAIPHNQRKIDVSFIGGFSNLHIESYQLMEYLAQQTPIQFWGYGIDTLPEDSLIPSRHHGEAWGMNMFDITSNSRIVVNRHGEIAENYACNMRLFEATGSGALLLTDFKDNLNELFEIGKEVIAYRSPEECAALINYYLRHPDEAEAIARAGQTRTIREHTYKSRMRRTSEILARHLRYKREKHRFPAPDMTRISYGHTPITKAAITNTLTGAWKDSNIPDRQRALVQESLSQMYKGEIFSELKVLADCIRPYIRPKMSLLEIGCASGYYYEILDYLLGMPLNYTGVDYSESMIKMAKDYYPKARFFAADGANLFFPDRHFPIVISSCILLHTPNYRDHIFETVRVSDKYVVAHRTPICRKGPTGYMKKFAYGVETVELIFNEDEFLREFRIQGMEMLDRKVYAAEIERDNYQITYLFRRTK
jgi:MoaA/NifB/PqqE/SkfB family radical SAM enzyme/SAM-dependent methyltransferase